MEVLLALGVFIFCLATTPLSKKEWRVYLLVLGLIAALWAYRGTKLLLNKRKHV